MPEWGFPGGSVVKNLPATAGNTGDTGSIHGSGRSPGGGNGDPLQDSCLGNPMDRGAWWATVHGVAKTCTQWSTHAVCNGQQWDTPTDSARWLKENKGQWTSDIRSHTLMLVFQKVAQRFFEIIWNEQMEPSCICPLLVLINLLI